MPKARKKAKKQKPTKKKPDRTKKLLNEAVAEIKTTRQAMIAGFVKLGASVSTMEHDPHGVIVAHPNLAPFRCDTSTGEADEIKPEADTAAQPAADTSLPAA